MSLRNISSPFERMTSDLLAEIVYHGVNDTIHGTIGAMDIGRHDVSQINHNGGSNVVVEIDGKKYEIVVRELVPSVKPTAFQNAQTILRMQALKGYDVLPPVAVEAWTAEEIEEFVATHGPYFL